MFGKGAFNDYVDEILPIFDHPPPPCVQMWTLQVSSTWTSDHLTPHPFQVFCQYKPLFTHLNKEIEMNGISNAKYWPKISRKIHVVIEYFQMQP